MYVKTSHIAKDYNIIIMKLLHTSQKSISSDKFLVIERFYDLLM